jgi:hypothetical protein
MLSRQSFLGIQSALWPRNRFASLHHEGERVGISRNPTGLMLVVESSFDHHGFLFS